MSIEETADFKIRASWEDNATGPLVSSTQKINAAWKQVRDETRTVQREFEINNRTLVASSRVIRSVTGVLRSGISLFQTWTLMQIRSQDASKNLREEQQSLHETFAEFGPNSKEYIKQLENVKNAEEELERTTKDNLIGTILLVSTAIGSVSTAAISAVPRVRQLNALLRNTKTTSTPSKTPIKPPTPSTGAKSGGFGGKVGGVAGGIASGAASAALFLLQLLGEQNASAPSSADSPDIVADNGIDAIKNVAGDIINVVNNIFSPTPDQMVNDINNGTQRAITFKAN